MFMKEHNQRTKELRENDVQRCLWFALEEIPSKEEVHLFENEEDYIGIDDEPAKNINQSLNGVIYIVPVI